MAQQKLTAEQRAERLAAVEYARVSVAMEGLEVPQPLLKMQQRYVTGELSIDQVIEATRKYYGIGPTSKA